jgi:hypothetical protein
MIEQSYACRKVQGQLMAFCKYSLVVRGAKVKTGPGNTVTDKKSLKFKDGPASAGR